MQFNCHESGTSAVEFAIIAPIFMLILLGAVAYGIYFGAVHSITQLAADAARTAVAGLNQTERQQLAQRFINSNAATYPFIDITKLTVLVEDNPVDPQQFVVSLQYDAAGLPIWKLIDGLPLPGKTIARPSTIRTGGI